MVYTDTDRAIRILDEWRRILRLAQARLHDIDDLVTQYEDAVVVRMYEANPRVTTRVIEAYVRQGLRAEHPMWLNIKKKSVRQVSRLRDRVDSWEKRYWGVAKHG